jgi:hypothetical protein
MENQDELMFFAGMALIGLVANGQDPTMAAKMAWDYAEHMHELKPRPDDGQ